MWTKQDAEDAFKRQVMPLIRKQYERDGIPDWPARREEWNNFTDALHRDGLITLRQYETWTHPSICKRPRRK